jgi:hypothetical protein
MDAFLLDCCFKGIVSRDWIHWIDLKFKGFRFMFIFNLNVVFTTTFLKVATIHGHFSPGLPPGAGFPGEELQNVPEILGTFCPF